MPQLTGWDLTCAVVLMTVATFCLECLITAIKNRPQSRKETGDES